MGFTTQPLSLLLCSFLVRGVVTFSSISRRSWFMAATTSISGGGAWIAGVTATSADATTIQTTTILTTSSQKEAEEEAVYFGAGCFWHIQHEFIQAERDLLGRGDKALTSLAGYAGGTSVGSDGLVCYHNMRNIADYGSLGHGEVVGMKLPTDKIVDFGKVYFSLFNPNTKERADPQDRGSEYRSLMGLPGGIHHPSYAELQTAAQAAGLKLEPGKGNDPDTLRRRLVYVYDTAKFPFYPAEVYHQYHNDFQSPPYGKAYNALADIAFREGRIQTTGCPDKV